MNRFYQLLPDFPMTPEGKPWFIDFPGQVSAKGYWFNEGKRVQHWDDTSVVAICEGSGNYSSDFMLARNGWPIFSNRFKDLVQANFPDAIQYLRFRFSPPSNSFEDSEHSIGQILALVDGIDRSNTNVDNGDWTPRSNGTFRVQYPIHLLERLVSDYPIFRLVGSPIQIFVREDFQQLLVQNELSGVRFDSNVPVH